MASLLETTLNTRDLGGYETRVPGVYTISNRVYRSDKQSCPSQRDVDFLLDRNITTIIDLRSEKDIAKSPSGFASLPQFRCINCPVIEGSGIPECVAAVPGSYLDIAHSEHFAEAFFALAEAPGGVMVNCSAGKDRTGVFSALLLTLCGVPRETVIADYMLTRENNAERFRVIHEQHPEIDMNIVIPRESFMEDFLNRLFDRHGSIENYYHSIGVGSEMQAAIRRKLLVEV